MRRTAPLSFGRSAEQVEGMMNQGTPFTRVEEAINAADLSRDHKAALWLLAWSLRDPARQRRDAWLSVAGAAAGG